jgi:hypothetical protein
MFESVLEASREALKAIMLITGGAVVVLLGFLGAILSKNISPSLGQSLALSMFQFSVGVLMAALGFGARYLSHTSYAGAKQWLGVAFAIVSIMFALTAYGLFGFGIYGSCLALLEHCSP